MAHVTGMAFIFGPNSANLSLTGATVAVAEEPSITTTVAADGSFQFDVPSGGPSSFSLTQDGFHPTQSATIDVTTDGIPMLGFQIPTEDAFDQLAGVARVTPNAKDCQFATTVSAFGTTPYGGDGLGSVGATVSIDPPQSADSGPIYFAYQAGMIYPDRTLTSTSMDGGAIYSNLAVGEYTLDAAKAGTQFTSVNIRCRAGVLVNAAPPLGIQEL